MRDRQRNREGSRVCVEPEVSALKAGEYSTWWQWVPKHYEPLHLALPFTLQLFHLKQFYVSPASGRRGGEDISWSRYTSFFLQWFTDPLKPFHAVSHWLTHLFNLPSAIHYLRCRWKDILLSLSGFPFLHLLSDWCTSWGQRPRAGAHTYL